MWSWLSTVKRAMEWPLGDLGSITSVTLQISCGLLRAPIFPSKDRNYHFQDFF